MNVIAPLRKPMRRLIEPLRAQCVILLYHRVAQLESDPWGLCVSPPVFDEHLTVLRRYRIVRLSGLSPDSLKPRSVAVTFDDGYADNLHCAKTLLEKHDVPATFFVTTGYLGNAREFWWDELERRILSSAPHSGSLQFRLHGTSHSWPLATPPERSRAYYEAYELLQPLADTERRSILCELQEGTFVRTAPRPSHQVLTGDQVRQLADGGLTEIGAHTVTHPHLAAQGRDEQKREIRESKQVLQEIIGRPIESFSYPFGAPHHYSPETVDLVRAEGFTRSCTAIAGVVRRDSDPHRLPRVNVGNLGGADFEELLRFHLQGVNR
jgi:peptidoglycan/xylan/chitin deacetylase (PgdA/CDA1 family)